MVRAYRRRLAGHPVYRGAVRFDISLPQRVAAGFDAEGTRDYLIRAEELGFTGGWTLEQTIGPSPLLAPLEMLACGGAVLASTADAVREVCGPHAAFFDPNDLPGWRAALLRLATDPGYRDDLRRDGVAHAARFTWERVVEETAAVYRRVLAPSVPGPAAPANALSSRPAA